MSDNIQTRVSTQVPFKGLDAFLLLALVFFYIFNTQFEPFGGLTYVLNFLRLAVVGIYFFATFTTWKKISSYRHAIKTIAIVVLVFITFVTSIFLRATLEDERGMKYGYHDGAIQTEDAYSFVKDGKNPYVENYYDVGLGTYAKYIGNNDKEWLNPALEHYIYLPATIFLVGFTGDIEESFMGVQDVRILTLIAFLILAFFVWRLVRDTEVKYIATILFVFNPILLTSFLEGRNDVIVLAWLVGALFALLRKKFILAGILFGVALATKQFAWIFVPFVFVYLLYHWKNGPQTKKQIIHFSISALLVASLFLLPFFLWNPSAFIDDTLLYASGTSETLNYPIVGYGFSPMVLLFGVTSTDAFPFWPFMLAFAGPVFYFMLRKVYREPTIANIVLGTALFIFSAFLFSRFLNDNYVLFISQLLLIWFAFSGQQRQKEGVRDIPM